MSVIVRTPEGKIKVMTKGADNVIFERLAEYQDDITKETLFHLRNFANEGICLNPFFFNLFVLVLFNE